jgi:hypothetical protein
VERFNNFVPMTLAVAALSGDTTLSLAGAYASLQTLGNYRLLVDSEIMLVTARAGSVVTVTRAQEGTSAVGHSIGAQVIPIVTSGALAQLEADAASRTLNVQLVTAPGVFAAAPGMDVFVDLNAAGGDVDVEPAGVAAGQGLNVKLINATGGHTCHVHPLAGGALESRAVPGTLLGVGVTIDLTVLGDELNLRSTDGTNLWQ